MKTAQLEDLPHYTYEDYCQWEGDWELINGIPYAMAPSPVITHQSLVNTVSFSLTASTRECEHCLVLPEQDWKVNDFTTVRPDVSLVCDEPGDAFITKPPQIIVEVLSKSSIKRDKVTKFKLYQEEKVPYYIIVDPSSFEACVYRLEDEHYVKQGDFSQERFDFEGLSCDASIDFLEVFRRF